MIGGGVGVTLTRGAGGLNCGDCGCGCGWFTIDGSDGGTLGLGFGGGTIVLGCTAVLDGRFRPITFDFACGGADWTSGGSWVIGGGASGGCPGLFAFA
jgi:hypothetical protein